VPTRRARSILRGGTFVLLALGAAFTAAAVPASRVIGPTFDIVEPDVLTEIESAVRARDWKSWMRRAPADYGAFVSARLPLARSDATRAFDPTYTMPFDIRDDKGNVLYPTGTRVNVYEKLKIAGRYIVIAPLESHYRWLDAVAKPSGADKVLLANGNILIARRHTGRNLYMLDDRFIERFGLRNVPAIVQQEGTHLRVTEYALAN
jgi:hypothetical protein